MESCVTTLRRHVDSLSSTLFSPRLSMYILLAAMISPDEEELPDKFASIIYSFSDKECEVLRRVFLKYLSQTDLETVAYKFASLSPGGKV